MSEKKTRGMKGKTQQKSGWWEEINTNSATNHSSQVLGVKSTRKRGNVQRNAQKKENFDPFALDKDPEAARKRNEDDPPLIMLDAKSPLIWSIGTFIIYIIIFICELVQNGGLQSLAKNPLGGPSDQTLILMGAKYGPAILSGDWWRFVASLFLHSGIFHLVLMLVLKICSSDVEKLSGFWRAVIVYFIAGVFGFVLSCLFIPEMVSTGSTGSHFGYIGLLLSDLISTWRGVEGRSCKLTKYIICIIITLVVGFTPYVDNFSNIGGFIVGFFCALMLLPNMNFGFSEQVCHGIVAFLAFPVFSLIFCICLVLMYRSIDPASTWCSFCHNFNCINISGWCPPIIESSQNTYYV